MKNKIFLVCIVSMVLVSGCITETIRTTESEFSSKYPITVTDDFGRNVTITKEPERIVSTAPSNTEILFALGLENKTVGVTEYCNYPTGALKKEKIGGFSTVNIEKIISLKPDLVVASGKTGNENIGMLENFGVSVVVLDPTNIEGILKDIELVGEITGTNENASKLVADMEERINAIKPPGEKLRVVYVVWHDPLMGAGKETFADDLIKKAGGINIANFTGYKVISLESVISENPDIIITSVGHGDAKNMTYGFILNEPGLRIVNAVKNGKIYGIDADLTGRGAPRIVDALEQFSEWIQG